MRALYSIPIEELAAQGYTSSVMVISRVPIPLPSARKGIVSVRMLYSVHTYVQEEMKKKFGSVRKGGLVGNPAELITT